MTRTHHLKIAYLVYGGPLEGVLLRMELRPPDGDAPLGLDQRDELHAVIVHVGRQSVPEGICKKRGLQFWVFAADLRLLQVYLT